MTNQVPTRPISRERAFDVIDGERDYQAKTYPETRTEIEIANLLIEYTDKLAADVVAGSHSSPTGGPLKRLREIAAIAVHGMELFGSQPRADHVPASAGITGTAHIVAKADSTKPTVVKAPVVGAKSPTPPQHTASTTAAHPAATEHVPATAHHAAEPVAEKTTVHPGATHSEPEHHK